MTDPAPALHRFPAGTYTRLRKPQSDILVQNHFGPVWPLQKLVFLDDMLINMAWVAMLAEQGIVPRPDAAVILEALRTMERAGPDAFPFDPRNGDLYFNIEAFLIEQVGPTIGGWLYTARSRNDGEPTTLRLFLRRRLVDLAEATVGLANTCLDLASQHLETVMPGYTGSQPAQPWTLGHYCLSFADAFGRDFRRITTAYPEVNQSLLGLGSGAGSDLPLDRARVADLLGFDGFIENSREFCCSADSFAEVVAVCSILLAHLGELAHDLDTWCTQEFGVVQLGDEFSGSSSFMPQKRNPIPLRGVRMIASGSVGLMPSILSLMRTSSQDFDLITAELRPIGTVIPAIQQAYDATTYLSAAISTLQVRADLMRERALRFWTTVSEVATLIVRERGLAWRTAHRITERFMLHALEAGTQPTDVTGEMLDRAALEIQGEPLGLSTDAIRRALDPLEFLRTRRTAGSPNPAEAARMLADRRSVWAERRRWCDARRADHAAARQRLAQAVDAVRRET